VTGGTPGNNFILAVEVDPRSLGVATAPKCQPQQQLSTLARINFGQHVTGGTPGNNFILAVEVDPRSTRDQLDERMVHGAALVRHGAPAPLA